MLADSIAKAVLKGGPEYARAIGEKLASAVVEVRTARDALQAVLQERDLLRRQVADAYKQATETAAAGADSHLPAQQSSVVNVWCAHEGHSLGGDLSGGGGQSFPSLYKRNARCITFKSSRTPAWDDDRSNNALIPNPSLSQRHPYRLAAALPPAPVCPGMPKAAV